MGELLYLVDTGDNVLGYIDRDQAYKILALHRSGMVFILNKQNKVFVQHRAETKRTFPRVYDASSTFHIVYGESYKEAAERELFEETGIKGSLKLLSKFLHKKIRRNTGSCCFLCHSDEIITLDPEEAASGEWMYAEQLDKVISENRTTPWLRDGFKLIKKYLAKG